MGTSIKVNGVLYDTGFPVFLWDEPGGFNGYYEGPSKNNRRGPRYKKTNRKIEDVTQFAVHHSGGDRQDPSIMYDVLWNQRFLSCQFALEDDGRIYQFLDPGVVAYHIGTPGNDLSVGVECCLFPDAKANPDYYSAARNAANGNLPHMVRTQKIQGMRKETFWMPEPQVEALSSLIVAVWCATGRSGSPKFPRDDNGIIPYSVLPQAQMKKHVGLVGHFHWAEKKWDPAGLDLSDLENRVEKRWRKYIKVQTGRHY